jgi:hypothetical protein
MKTPKAYRTWIDAQPEQQTCADCGKTGPSYHVQPQWNWAKGSGGGPLGYALCSDCINARNRQHDAEHKAALALEPRCEVEGCTKRGTYNVGHEPTLLCGWHLRAARKNLYKSQAMLGGLALFLPIPTNRHAVLAFATKKESN